MRRKTEGFTLIELLVVIAIIAILAAILFPVLTNARRQGRVASCQSNIKQIGTSVYLYADDHQGQMMPYDTDRYNPAKKKMWWDHLHSYMRAGKIYRCPELLDSRSTSGAGGPNNRVYGYGINNCVQRSENPLKMSVIPRPSKILMFADAYTLEDVSGSGALAEVGFPVVYSQRTVSRTTLPYLKDGNISGRHDGSWNRNATDFSKGRTVVIYVDGHTKTWPRQYLIDNPATRSQSKTDDIWGDFDVWYIR